MPCYCIKKLDISIKRLTSEYFTIIDDSVVVAQDVDLAQEQEFELRITDSDGNSFSVMVPVNGKRTYSVSEVGACMFKDGVYCLDVYSCGTITDKIVYAPNLYCEIKNQVAKGADDSFYRSLMSKFEVMEILGRHGRIVEAEKKYIELCRLLGVYGMNFGDQVWMRNVYA